MNLYLISQIYADGYDTYDSAVVAAASEQEARETHPSPFVTHHRDGVWYGTYADSPHTRKRGTCGKEYVQDGYDWVPADQLDLIEVELLGTTDRDAGVICASFNAG